MTILVVARRMTLCGLLVAAVFLVLDLYT